MFRYGSPFHRLMTLVSNLMLLNLLWLITSLPLVTLGASTTAMYYVTMQYVTKQDDSVFRAYFRAFKENFRQATFLWIPHGLLCVALVVELYYLTLGQTSSLWWLVFGILGGIFCMVSGMLYPMIARYRNSTRAIVINSINLSVRNLFPMLCVTILNLAPIVLLLQFTGTFLYLGLVWSFGGFSLIAYVNSAILLGIFKKYEPREQEE